MTKAEAARVLQNTIAYESNFAEAKLMAIRALLEPERKTGRWKEDNSCPFCGKQPWYEHDIHTLSFCPYCGAKMEVER